MEGYVNWIIALAVVLFIILFCIFLIRRQLKAGGIIRVQPQGPLVGIKIIDMSVVIAAPWAASHLSELGAEVIKVETMSLFDSARAIGASPVLGMGGMVAHSGRGKQSILINLKTEKGKEVFMKFVKECDILIENFRPGTMERLGIDYKILKNTNPDIIMLSSTGFGPTGPYSTSRIYDPIIQAYSGVTHIQGQPPRLIPHFIMDKMTAMTSTQAIIAALVARDTGAGGQHIDIRMLNCAMQFVWCDTFHNHTWVDQEEKGLDSEKSLVQESKKKGRVFLNH